MVRLMEVVIRREDAVSAWGWVCGHRVYRRGEQMDGEVVAEEVGRWEGRRWEWHGRYTYARRREEEEGGRGADERSETELHTLTHSHTHTHTLTHAGSLAHSYTRAARCRHTTLSYTPLAWNSWTG